MNDLWAQVFHHLPPPARTVVASLRGRYLAAWRYGSQTERLVAEALDRDQWSTEKWQAYQDERLAIILRRASQTVPYYRDQWAARRRAGDRASTDYLENWPILEKESLRANPTAFVASDCNRRWMFHEQTSGTSGTCLDLWRSRDTVQAWYALFEARCRRWYGLSRDMRWAILGGQLVRPIAKREPPFWIWNSALNQLYMSSYHLAPELIPSYVDALRAYDIKYVFGFTSSLYALAQEIVRQGRDDIRMAAAVTQGEPVFDYQRATIGQAFHCPVREGYGMAEIVVAASECDEGRLHLWPETGLVEVLNANDQPAAPGETGELVCTGLLNADMPLIRYRLGDRGALAPDTPCPCGRRLPTLAALAGRVDEVIYTTDGRPLGRLDSILRTRVPIREAQIVQETLDRVRVRLVPAPGFTQSAVDEITNRLRARLGQVQVVIESLPEVPRTANGKFRAVICQVPRAEVERRRAAASVPVS